MASRSLSAGAEAEAMAIVAASDPEAIAELDAVIAHFQVDVSRHVDIPASGSAHSLQSFFCRILPTILVRRHAESLRAFIVPETTARPTLSAELARAAAQWGGRSAPAAWDALQALIKSRLAGELAEIDARLDRYRGTVQRRHPVGFRDGGADGSIATPTEHRHASIAELVSQRHSLVSRIAALETTGPKPVEQIWSEHVTRAIEGAGGPHAVAEAIKAMRIARGTFFSRDPAAAELETAEARSWHVEASLERLGVAATAPAGSHAANLHAEWMSLIASANTLRSEITDRQNQAILDLIGRAMEGKADAREQLLTGVREQYTAIPNGLELMYALDEAPAIHEPRDAMADELVRRLVPDAG
jgi:hypothetical protein